MLTTDAPELRGVWIYGSSGVGKSVYARKKFPNAYPKLCNKWWDGYQSQENVIMDDIGKEHKCLGQQLKIWGDRYGCILENKGGSMPSAHVHFVVTSQYSIEDIFWEDKHTQEALLRRYEQRILTPRPGAEPNVQIKRRVNPSEAAAGPFFKPI